MRERHVSRGQRETTFSQSHVTADITPRRRGRKRESGVKFSSGLVIILTVTIPVSVSCQSPSAQTSLPVPALWLPAPPPPPAPRPASISGASLPTHTPVHRSPIATSSLYTILMSKITDSEYLNNSET
ncbi:unnamed protein product [Pleuronectes platessa]|uniref:Uncharacterized protein n=1 Tax=Pleuronectes platessa TaxID=8262 RepID=A0A9N7TP30_PLEPL|nr:unnamed protein product [Pleuronectes platessa]